MPTQLFGMHLIHTLHTRTNWPQVPVTNLRIWDNQTAWSDIQPTATRWNWQRLDASVGNARGHGAAILMTLGMTPRWASTRPGVRTPYGMGAAYVPRSMATWRAYVRAVATRYKGRIQAYEIWNEPNWFYYWDGTPRQLAALTREAYGVIKKVDPKAIVLSPSWVPKAYGNDKLMSGFFAAGGGRYIDAVAVHLYAETPEQSISLLADSRKTLAKAGVGHLPLWNTEVTYGRRQKGDRFSGFKSAGIIARTYLLAPYSAQKRVYWYAWDDWDFGATEMWSRSTQRPTAGARAYREVYDWMVGSRTLGCTRDYPVFSCAFALREGGRGLAVWSIAGKRTRRVPTGYRHIHNLGGGTTRTASGRSLVVTSSPVLLTTS